MTPSRRSFCELLGSAFLMTGAPARANASSGPASPLGPVTYQLAWLETVEYAGTYIAESRGYYRDQGIAVTVLPGGPNVAVIAQVVAGKALVGNSKITSVAQARLNGARLKIVGAGWQRSPFVFLSLASNPVRTPRDLIGKRLGVPASDLVLARSFLRLSHIDERLVQFVPVQYDPSPLVAGEVDAFFGISTDEEITLKLRGVAIHAMALEDFGYSGLEQLYVVREDSLADPAARTRIMAFLRAERLGWRDALRDPRLGAELAVQTYGAQLGLDLNVELAQGIATNALLTSPDTRTHGLFWMSKAKIGRAVEQLQRDGIAIRTSDLFDTSLLTEINRQEMVT